MLALSRWMIRFSLIYLLAGISMGALMLINKAFILHPAIWMLLPIHIEFLLFGWIIQITLGVAYWILPRFMTKSPRGNNNLALWMAILLNAGILIVAFSHINLLPNIFSIIGRIAEAAAVLIFISLHWG